MLRQLEKSDDGFHLYAFTARGVMVVSMLLSMNITMGVLGIAALQNTRAQNLRERDALCRIKHYETLSGGTVLNIAVKFKLISLTDQKDWREALKLVADIPAASKCSGRI